MRRLSAVAVPLSVRLGGPHPLHFGRARHWVAQAGNWLPSTLGPDAKLFLTAYAAGFLTISLLIA